jgi:hypothetical protein
VREASARSRTFPKARNGTRVFPRPAPPSRSHSLSISLPHGSARIRALAVPHQRARVDSSLASSSPSSSPSSSSSSTSSLFFSSPSNAVVARKPWLRLYERGTRRLTDACSAPPPHLSSLSLSVAHTHARACPLFGPMFRFRRVPRALTRGHGPLTPVRPLSRAHASDPERLFSASVIKVCSSECQLRG